MLGHLLDIDSVRYFIAEKAIIRSNTEIIITLIKLNFIFHHANSLHYAS